MKSTEPFVVWFTGLSGSGKTTAACALEERLHELDVRVQLLDGDVIRATISKDLGFSKADRDTNILRIGEMCRQLTSNGISVVVATISPYAAARSMARASLPNFVEVYMQCGLGVLITRDTKGLYGKAFAGEFDHMTGISDPYEEPTNADITIHSEIETVSQGVEQILTKLKALGLIHGHD